MPIPLKNIFHIDHIIVAIFTILIIKLLVVIALNFSFFSPVVRAVDSFSMTDVYYWIQNRELPTETNTEITLVDITELSRRKDIAQVISEIKSMNPLAIGVDIIFEGRQLDGDGDSILTLACLEGNCDNIVWACKLTQYDQQQNKFQDCLHSFFITEGLQNEGFINMVSNPAKSIKKHSVTLPYKDTLAYSLPVQIASLVSKEPITYKNQHSINYKPTSFPIVKYDELQSFRQLIDGHIVLLGETKAERDMYYTPIGQKSGMEILAYTILSITDDKNVQHAGAWMIILWALIAGYITNLTDFMLTKRLERRKASLMMFITQSEFYDKVISFAVMVLITGASFELFAKHNYFVDTVLALSTVVLIDEGRLLYAAILSLLKKHTNWKFIKKSLYYEPDSQ